MIEVADLTKRYGECLAVNRISFKVDKGLIWGLLGPNAAGKTTTMRILTGYIPATDGRAVVAGLDVFEKPDEVKKAIGYLPENPPLYPDMTVSSYLDFVAEIKGVPSSKIKGARAKALQATGLEGVRGRLIKNISRGYKQRVGIAQALIHDPQVLILDEPTVGLDPAQIVEIRELIKSLRGGHTIMISTHILAEVTQVCDGVVIINQGNLMASGSLGDLTASYIRNDGVVLRLREGGEPAAGLFRALPGVLSAVPSGDEIRIEWPRGSDHRDAIVRIAADKGLGLREMRSAAMNIEDLYLKIVSGGLDR